MLNIFSHVHLPSVLAKITAHTIFDFQFAFCQMHHEIYDFFFSLSIAYQNMNILSIQLKSVGL
jgi:hypothetical protein